LRASDKRDGGASAAGQLARRAARGFEP